MPLGRTMGAVRLVNACAPRMGSWLIVWTPSRRRLAAKPICRRSGRLVSRLGMPKSAGASLMVVSVRSVCSSGCSPVLADQAVNDLSVLDPCGDIDCLTGLVQWRSLFPRLVRPVLVVMPCVLGQSPVEVSFAVDQHVVQALASQCSYISFRKRVRSG